MADNDKTDDRERPAHESEPALRLQELQTLNGELKLKLAGLSRAHGDLQYLIAAIDFGTLFLDAGLRIKRFTEPIKDLFSIVRTDEGRLITDFDHHLDYGDFISDVRAVLADAAPIRREVRGRDGNWYDMRIRPYRDGEDTIGGVVITFFEASDQHRVEQALRQHEELLRQQKHLIDLSRDPIFVWDFDNGIVDWNRGSEQLYGFQPR